MAQASCSSGVFASLSGSHFYTLPALPLWFLWSLPSGVILLLPGVVVLPQLANKHHTAARSLPPSGMGERIRRVKVRKLTG